MLKFFLFCLLLFFVFFTHLHIEQACAIPIWQLHKIHIYLAAVSGLHE